MQIKNAKYITSVVEGNKLLESEFNEFAFVGRSNVGKSSLINSLVNIKNLAKTSSAPGHTKMVNYFMINDNIYFVDLPGYGFSKTGKSHQILWSTLIENYLIKSSNLKRVFLLVDLRHKPTEQDKQMQNFLFHYNIPFTIIATKADKIAKTKIKNYCQIIASELKVGVENIIPHSSENAYNRDKILELIEEINNYGENNGEN